MSLPLEVFPPIDRENAFLLYATFCGDVVRTAHSLNVPPAAVLKAAEEENWQAKLGPILALKTSAKPGDIERAINRALAFVQAHQMRLFVSRVIRRLTGFTEEEFEDYILPEKRRKDGSVELKLSTRAIADLASAMEKCNVVAFLALNDTVQDRTRRKEDESKDDGSTQDLHAKLAEAMANVSQSNSPRIQLFDAQVQEAAAQVERSQRERRESPADNDDH